MVLFPSPEVTVHAADGLGTTLQKWLKSTVLLRPVPPLLALRFAKIWKLTPVLRPSQILSCLLHFSKMSHLLTSQGLVNNMRLGSTNILLLVSRKETVYALCMDLIPPQKWSCWFSIGLQHFSEMCLPLRHPYRFFSTIWLYSTYIYIGGLQRVQRVSAHVLAPTLTNLIPDLCWSKNWACSSLHLPSCTLVPIRRKPDNSCSCQVLDLDFAELLKACKSVHLLLSVETTWGTRLKGSEKLQPKHQAGRLNSRIRMWLELLTGLPNST